MRIGRYVGALVALGSLLAACGVGTPAGGDPGGRRLHELRADQVFAAFPPGATDVQVQATKARYRQPGFTGGGWDGPSVVVSFSSPSPAADVFRFVGDRAAAAGWRQTSTNAEGFADGWTKTYGDGARAWLLLVHLPERPQYRLSGSVATVSG